MVLATMVAAPLRKVPFLFAALTSVIGLAAACTQTPEPQAACPRCPEPRQGNVVCPANTERDGDKCVRTDVLTVVKCPADSHLEDGQCLREVADCPAGTTFKAGTGCVPVMVAVPIDPPPNATVPGGLTGTPGKSKCPAGMAYIPGGSFTLGGYIASAGTTVSVKNFCLDVTEVTVGDYRACVKKGTCKDAKLSCNPDSATWKAGDDKLPLNCVDYTESATFCASTARRLATEDEFEWAARGGSLARKYPWGPNEDWTRVCASTPSRRTLPCRAGSFPGGATPQGVNDLAGSLWEWTTSPRPGDNLAKAHQAIRGGGWDIVVGFPSFASGSRVGYEPTYRSKAVGFRCAKGA